MKRSISITTGVLAALAISVPAVSGITAYANTHSSVHGQFGMSAHGNGVSGNGMMALNDNGTVHLPIAPITHHPDLSLTHHSPAPTSHQQALATLKNEIQQLHAAQQNEMAAKSRLVDAVRQFAAAMDAALHTNNQSALQTGMDGLTSIHSQIKDALSFQQQAKKNLQQYTVHKGKGDLSRAIAALTAAVNREEAKTTAMNQAADALDQLTGKIEAELASTASSQSGSASASPSGSMSGSASGSGSGSASVGGSSSDGNVSAAGSGGVSIAGGNSQTTMQTYVQTSGSLHHNHQLPLLRMGQ